MSTASIDFEKMLQDAINQAADQEARRTRDLFSLASDASRAVSNVTAGAAILELAPIDSTGMIFQLDLRKVRSNFPPEDLGIFRVTEGAYPIDRWSNRTSFEASPGSPDTVFSNVEELRAFFVHLLSDPSSKLVIAVGHLKRSQPPTPRAPY